VCSPSDKESARTGITTLSPTTPAVAASNNMNFKRGIAYRTTISGTTVKDRRANVPPARAGTFAVPQDANDESSSIGRGTGGRGLSFFDKLTSKFSRRFVQRVSFSAAPSESWIFFLKISQPRNSWKNIL